MTTSNQIDDRLLGILANLTERDHAGRRFVETTDHDDLGTLEATGLIAIRRPIHEPTGLPYSEEYWALTITKEGQRYVDDHYDRRDYEADGITPVA